MKKFTNIILSALLSVGLLAIPAEGQASGSVQKVVQKLRTHKGKTTAAAVTITTLLYYYLAHHRPYAKAMGEHQLDVANKGYAVARTDAFDTHELRVQLSSTLDAMMATRGGSWNAKEVYEPVAIRDVNSDDYWKLDFVRWPGAWKMRAEELPPYGKDCFAITTDQENEAMRKYARELIGLFKEELGNEEHQAQELAKGGVKRAHPLRDIYKVQFDDIEKLMQRHEDRRRTFVGQHAMAQRAIPLSPWQQLKAKLFPPRQVGAGPVTRG